MHITFSLHNRSFSLVFIHTQKKLTEFVVRVEKLYGAINVQLSGLNENLFTATRALFLERQVTLYWGVKCKQAINTPLRYILFLYIFFWCSPRENCHFYFTKVGQYERTYKHESKYISMSDLGDNCKQMINCIDLQQLIAKTDNPS